MDACLQTQKEKNEYRALTDMVDRSNLGKNNIIIADRGYEGYNVLAHIHENVFYPISFRVIRPEITENKYETIIINLDADAFSIEEIKYLNTHTHKIISVYLLCVKILLTGLRG